MVDASKGKPRVMEYEIKKKKVRITVVSWTRINFKRMGGTVRDAYY